MELPWEHMTVHPTDRCGRVRCEPGWRLARAWSQRLDDLDLWLVWAGRGTMQLRDGQRVELRPGVAIWMRPGGLYLAEQDPANRLGVTYLHFDLTDPATGRRPARLPAEVHELRDVAYADGVMRRVVELLRPHRSGVRDDTPAAWVTAEMLLRGFLMDLDAGAGRARLRAAAGTAAHHRKLVMSIAAAIRENPGEVESVGELARQAGYSTDHFTRIFRQVLGQNPRDYIVEQRLVRARQLLSESSLTVTQIADALGYESVYFFSRQFKEKTGRSPSAYRRA